MMEQSPFKMDTFPNFFSGRGTTDAAEAEVEADTADLEADTAEVEVEQPMMMVIGQDKITL